MEITLGADYGEAHNKEALQAFANEKLLNLDLEKTQLEVAVHNIAALPNDQYAMLRKEGFGGSDSSIILGVNPYKRLDQLIQEKIETELSAEEKETGNKLAVVKGRDLEPLVISRFEYFFQQECTKPVDMYRFREYPWLTMNYDGVTKMYNSETPSDYIYIPNEIKIVTRSGQRHYQPQKALFQEGLGFGPMPLDVSDRNWDINTKAYHYGIPPYYYTQLQQEMMGVNAPYGHLTVLFDSSWMVYSFLVYKDQKVWNELIVRGYKAWEMVEEARRYHHPDFDYKKRRDDIVATMKEKHIGFQAASNITPVDAYMHEKGSKV